MAADLLSIWSAPIAAWVLTFAVHSTILLGVAWIITTRWRRLSDACQEVFWKAACVGAILTTSCQLALVSQPLAGHIAQLGTAQLGSSTSLVSESAGASIAVTIADPTPPGADFAATWVGQVGSTEPVALAGLDWFLLAVLLLAGLGCVHGLVAGHRSRRILAERVPLRSGPGPAMLGQLCARVGYWRALRLSQHQGLRTPIAFGALRPEICLPTRTLTDLAEPQQMSILAHELGHLLRRDPLWLRINGLLIALFPWQPLLHLCRRRIQILAEYRCDALAAEITGNLEAAGCLLEVAGWVAAEKHHWPAAVTGMVLRTSSLKMRIDRLLAGDLPNGLGRQRLWLLPMSTALLTVATTVLPGASLEHPEPRLDDPQSIQADTQQSPADLLGRLIMQMDMEFANLSHEVKLLREELAVGSQNSELSELLTEFDLKLASLERHRQLFLGVLEEWSHTDDSAPDPDPGSNK